MLNKRGWSALEYLIMTCAVVGGLVLGAASIKTATEKHLGKIATQIENTNVSGGNP
jgi:hypothetical protein